MRLEERKELSRSEPPGSLYISAQDMGCPGGGPGGCRLSAAGSPGSSPLEAGRRALRAARGLGGAVLWESCPGGAVLEQFRDLFKYP